MFHLQWLTIIHSFLPCIQKSCSWKLTSVLSCYKINWFFLHVLYWAGEGGGRGGGRGEYYVTSHWLLQMQGMYIVASDGSNKRKASVMLCTEAGSSGSAVQSKKFLWERLLMTANNGQKNFSALHAVSWLLHSFCIGIESPPYWLQASLFPPPGVGIRHSAVHWCFQVDTSQGLHCKSIPKWTLILATQVIKVLHAHTIAPTVPMVMWQLVQCQE